MSTRQEGAGRTPQALKRGRRQCTCYHLQQSSCRTVALRPAHTSNQLSQSSHWQSAAHHRRRCRLAHRQVHRHRRPLKVVHDSSRTFTFRSLDITKRPKFAEIRRNPPTSRRFTFHGEKACISRNRPNSPKSAEIRRRAAARAVNSRRAETALAENGRKAPIAPATGSAGRNRSEWVGTICIGYASLRWYRVHTLAA